ncbi:MAG: ABC transporter ATP-binding protein/permease [Oscillospiraceae bacterium]|nr:ABC transporter ATP-binding protein/permease [Oscillospiraceae bacterium]
MNEKSKGTVGWLWDFSNHHRGGYITSLICAAAGVACGMAPYFCVSQIIIALMNQVREPGLYGTYCLAAAGFWLLRYLLHDVSTLLSHRATFTVLSEVRGRLAKKLTSVPMGFLMDTPSGRLKNIMVERVDSMETTLAHIVPEMSGNILVSIATIIYLFVLDWRMGLVSLITIPIGLLCYLFMMAGYEKRFSNYVIKNKQLNDTAVEYIGGIEVIKAFHQSASSYEKFTSAAKEAAASAIEWMRSTLLLFSTALSVFPAVLVSVLPIGCIFYMNGTLSLETFVITMILSLGIMGPLVTVMGYADDLGKISTIVKEISDVLTVPDLKRPTEEVTIDHYDIHLHDVSFSYCDTTVLHGINLSIPAGSVTALVGPSGSGKSTIAKLIASLWDVGGGDITIGGTDIREIPLAQLNHTIAYVSQDNYLFDETIRENIRMGDLSATDQQVEEVARRSGCHDFIMQLEHGYETRAGGAGGHLSGGERQRITIARAMLKNAPIVILDEATAYTDPENEAVIQAAVSKLVVGKTLIVIAHRLSTITDSDNIIVMDHGRISAQGTHHALLAASGLYRNMWAAHNAAKDRKSTEGEMV